MVEPAGPTAATSAAHARLRLVTGLLLGGQGLLVVLGILDHEVPLPMAWALVAGGLGLAAWGRVPRLAVTRRGVVVGVGALASTGVLGYNLVARSSLVLAEVAILAYGLVLLVAAWHLGRRVGPTDVGTLVAFSFPLVLAPLSLYAVNAATTTQAGATPLAWYIGAGLVAPMTLLLRLGGMEAAFLGSTVRIATPEGPLFLTVGTVCAGLYAAALFLGVFALFAWERRTPPRRLALYLAVGLGGLHLANVLRLALLGYVGHAWGADALMAFHRHLGWALFLAWSLFFWWLVLRRLEGPLRRGASG